MQLQTQQLYQLLEEKAARYNQAQYIKNDPICIPHRFSKLQDIEIMGFWAATLAWGQRKTIINSCNRLLQLMDNAPHDFILNHTEGDLKAFESFKHRTFNYTDTLSFLHFLQGYYRQHNSLEWAFAHSLTPACTNTAKAIAGFSTLFFTYPYPGRVAKHIATPVRKSACKRINMFLRWMVRQDNKGFDFGLWKTISPAQLVCPLDVHVERVARSLGLLHRTQTDWQAAVELTENLKAFDAYDPVKYDFALFGLGVEEGVR